MTIPHQILRGERQRCQQVFDSYKRRLVAVSGGCAMAGGFATYLGPYHHNFRRVMLTVHWPNCLRERGIPLVIDSVDVLRGQCMVQHCCERKSFGLIVGWQCPLLAPSVRGPLMV